MFTTVHNSIISDIAFIYIMVTFTLTTSVVGTHNYD